MVHVVLTESARFHVVFNFHLLLQLLQKVYISLLVKDAIDVADV